MEKQSTTALYEIAVSPGAIPVNSKQKNTCNSTAYKFFIYLNKPSGFVTALLWFSLWWRVGEMDIYAQRKNYQQDTRLQNIIHRSGAFSIASNYILLALCSFTT